MATAIVVNGTYIVPDGFPTAFRPDQLDKLGLTGAITLGWPTIIGGIALMFGARNWRQVSPCLLFCLPERRIEVGLI